MKFHKEIMYSISIQDYHHWLNLRWTSAGGSVIGKSVQETLDLFELIATTHSMFSSERVVPPRARRVYELDHTVSTNGQIVALTKQVELLVKSQTRGAHVVMSAHHVKTVELIIQLKTVCLWAFSRNKSTSFRMAPTISTLIHKLITQDGDSTRTLDGLIISPGIFQIMFSKRKNQVWGRCSTSICKRQIRCSNKLKQIFRINRHQSRSWKHKSIK